MLDNKKKFKKGIALYLTLIILGLLLAMGMGLGSIILTQTKMSKEINFFLNAFYAADAGAEAGLYKIFKEHYYTATTFSDFLDSASYTVEICFNNDVNCPFPTDFQQYGVFSHGEFKGILRNISVSY